MTTDAEYVPPRPAESITATVARLDERTLNTARDVTDMKSVLTVQSGQLDLLVADLNTRKGAEAQTSKLGRTIVALFAIGGPLGAVWAYFHGR